MLFVIHWLTFIWQSNCLILIKHATNNFETVLLSWLQSISYRWEDQSRLLFSYWFDLWLRWWVQSCYTFLALRLSVEVQVALNIKFLFLVFWSRYGSLPIHVWGLSWRFCQGRGRVTRFLVGCSWHLSNADASIHPLVLTFPLRFKSHSYVRHQKPYKHSSSFTHSRYYVPLCFNREFDPYSKPKRPRYWSHNLMYHILHWWSISQWYNAVKR